MTSRDRALRQIESYFDKGGYFEDLAALVQIPTESQRDDSLADMWRYLESGIKPLLDAMGYTCRIFDNPVDGSGPILVAERHEGNDLPTIFTYGHGDVVRGMKGAWANDMDPFSLTFDGDRVYGRGVADNKGQHAINIAALKTVIETRGHLGFTSKFVVETCEETRPSGLGEVVAAVQELLN